MRGDWSWLLTRTAWRDSGPWNVQPTLRPLIYIEPTYLQTASNGIKGRGTAIRCIHSDMLLWFLQSAGLVKISEPAVS